VTKLSFQNLLNTIFSVSDTNNAAGGARTDTYCQTDYIIVRFCFLINTEINTEINTKIYYVINAEVKTEINTKIYT
jgi:hypothetical protein